MEDRNSVVMNYVLNETKHLKRFLDFQNPFKPQKANMKALTKPILKGLFFCYSAPLKQFKQFFFELYPNILVKYQDRTKAPPAEYLSCQHCIIFEENEVIGEQVAFGIILQNEEEATKLVTDKFQVHKIWSKNLRKYCKLTNFLQRYKVENRIYDHFYRCIDKKKKQYVSVKIINKKGLKPEQKRFVDCEIECHRRIVCPLMPTLKKVYEDENYIYLTFVYFKGDDLLTICTSSRLQEIAVATLAYHILKGLKAIHAQGCFHGNLKLENIIFCTTKNDNQIYFINFKYMDEVCEEYREKLIKRGNNFYVAPEVLEDKPFNQNIDLFALGVCLFFMIFNKFPYTSIEKEKLSEKYNYVLDLSVLEEIQKTKKKDPTSKQQLSASGIDFLMKLLLREPDKRPTAAQLMNHHWFINFTSRQVDHKKQYKQNNGEITDIMSLRTIIESSEMSEREIDCGSGLFKKKKKKKKKEPIPTEKKNKYSESEEETDTIDDNYSGSDSSLISEEEISVQVLMKDLDARTYPKQPSKDKHLAHPNYIMQQYESSNYITEKVPNGNKKDNDRLNDIKL